MADNTALPGGGDIIATDDVGGVKYQRVKPAWGVDGTAVDTSATNPLPTSQNASIFRFSTNNSSTVQLAAGATFTGVIETALDQPSASILMTCDQPMQITVYQYIDVSGVYAAAPIVYNIEANRGFAVSMSLNGNYVSVSARNLGQVATTRFNLNVAYGTLPSADLDGNLPVSYAQADAIAYFLSAILEKMPRLSREDRANVQVSDAGGNELNSPYYGISSNMVGEATGGRQHNRIFEPWQFSNAGSAYIYNQIIVS